MPVCVAFLLVGRELGLAVKDDVAALIESREGVSP